MPRRRLRLTMKKKRNAGESWKSDYTAPDEKEWRSWPGYNTFVVEDDEKNEHVFRKGDVALILPHDIAPEVARQTDDTRYWIGKIRKIRALSELNVWAKVQWYYTPEDVACIVKSFDTTTCGRYERIFSDHYDLVHSTCFSGLTTMTRFAIDDDPSRQKYIGRREFYCRYDFEHRGRRLEPKQKAYACKICSKPYSPDNSDPQQLMHFCPRPSCRTFYHESCLEVRKGLTEGSRSLQLIATWPDEDKKETIFDMLSYTRGENKGSRSDTDPEEISTTIMDFLGSLPNGLVKVAEQPIVRGAAFGSGGISGNISYVILARRMIYEVLRGSSVPDDWSKDIDLVKAIVNTKMGAKKKPIATCVCPECDSII